MDEGMQRCQRCGAMAWDWLCWTHWEEYCAEAEKAEAEAEAEARFAEVRDRLLDAELDKAERRLARKGWY